MLVVFPPPRLTSYTISTRDTAAAWMLCVMSFDVPADSYDRFMGRYAEPLAAEFVALAELRPGRRVLDVGCGPGALTTRLVEQLGADAVTAIDPSPSFVEAIQERMPEVDVRTGAAEQLPFADRHFDAALAQLVVHFMTDPVAGLREMARVTRSGGVVAACVWDQAGGSGPISLFWQAAHDINPGVQGESSLAGTREGQLVELFTAAGLSQVEPSSLTVKVGYASFEEWWEPYTLGVGPVGVHVASLDERERDALRDRCAELLPPAPFEMSATAWCARGIVL